MGATNKAAIEALDKRLRAQRKAGDRLNKERDRRYKEVGAERDRALNAALASSEKAVLKAEEEAKAWRASANEWRAAMTDRESRFVATGDHNAVVDRIGSIEKRIERGDGKSSGLNAGWVILLGAVGLIGGIGGLVSLVVALTR